MLWLTLVQGIPQDTARTINLLFFLPSAAIACLFRRKQGVLNLKALIPGILAGCIGAVLFSWIGRNLNTKLIKKGFGLLLLITGIRELRYQKKTP